MSLTDKTLKIFYLATPAFMLIDYIFEMDIRVSFLDNSPYMKAGYYLICICIGILMHYFSGWVALIGIFECAVNILMLTSSILIPYIDNIDAVANGMIITKTLDKYGLINYLLSGSILIVSFRARESILRTIK